MAVNAQPKEQGTGTGTWKNRAPDLWSAQSLQVQLAVAVVTVVAVVALVAVVAVAAAAAAAGAAAAD